MIDANNYWQHLARSYRPKKPLLTHQFVRGETLEEECFSEVRRVSFELFARSLNPANPIDARTREGQDEIYRQLNATKTFTLKKNPDLLAELDFLLWRLMKDRGLLEGMEGFQFPVNLRCVHPAPPVGYTEGAYATDHRHCDPWVGAPPDMINCFLYIYGSENTSKLDFCAVTNEQRGEFSRFRAAYREGADLVKDLPTLGYEPAPGQFILFDAFVPHQTIRRGTDVRLSIDFRLRARDPYEYLKPVSEKEFLGTPQYCETYWYPNTGSARKFNERYSQEVERLTAVGNAAAIELRRSTALKLQASV